MSAPACPVCDDWGHVPVTIPGGVEIHPCDCRYGQTYWIEVVSILREQGMSPACWRGNVLIAIGATWPEMERERTPKMRKPRE